MRSSSLLTALVLGAIVTANPIVASAAEPRVAPAPSAPAVPPIVKPVISAKAEAALRKRAHAGEVDAQLDLGVLQFHRMQASKVPLDHQNEAMRWFTLAEQNGSARAKAYLSFLMVWGLPPPGGRDIAGALRLAQEGADANDGMSLFVLAGMYQLGQGVASDPGKAVALELRAADAGWLKAQTLAASRYLHGNMLEKDPVKGEHYLELAAMQGDLESQTTLGGLYAWENKWGVPKNAKGAVHWLTAAADERHARAQFVLGALYCVGIDEVKANVPKAKALLRKALAQGHPGAREVLKECGVKR